MKTNKISSALAVLVLISAGTVFAAEPQFYPNAKYNSAPAGQVQQDVGECGSKASQFVEGQGEPGVARKGVRSAAKGAALGALAGSVTGNNAGRSAGAGAAVGGVVGTTRAARERGSNGESYQKYATVCLEEKGYKVVAWK